MSYFIHREGHALLRWSAILCLLIQGILYVWMGFVWWVALLGLILWGLILQFFRVPRQNPIQDPLRLYAPANGKILHIQSIHEAEYFQKSCLCLSIFMSPLDPHINRAPVQGQVVYVKHHPGKYLMAFYKKSSVHNEHLSCVFRTANGAEVLVRQIAGFLARRIACYAQNGQAYQTGDEYGFIRFGSRLDVFVSADAVKVLAKKGDYVRAGRTPIAEWTSKV